MTYTVNAHEAKTHLPDLHRDPYYRLIIAQGQLEDLPILTVDPIFAQYDINAIY